MSWPIRNNWKEKLFLLFQLALLTQCQRPHHHPPNHQIVPLSTHPISPAAVDRKATQGLAAVQRFRQILRLQENQSHGINRFPQSLPNPLTQPDGGSETTGRPKTTRVPESGIPSHSQSKGQGSLEGVQGAGINNTRTNSPAGQSRPKLLNHHQIETSSNFSSNFQELGPSQDGTRTPETARVPKIPEHLPIDLVNRLQEFPSLAASFEKSPAPATLHAFFEPTQEVQAEELTDEEWHQYLVSEWGSHGIVPTLLTRSPNYVANVNYGGHLCLHLGNLLTPAQARHKPKSFEFPGDTNRQYTVMLLDMDHSTGVYLHWLSINVPLNQINKGTDVVEYVQPQPTQGSSYHRMVFLVYQQKTPLSPKEQSLPRAIPCQISTREGIDLNQLTRDLSLEGPTAGNYFLTEWDVTVEHVCSGNL